MIFYFHVTIENYDFPGLITRGEVHTVEQYINELEVILRRIIGIFVYLSLEY